MVRWVVGLVASVVAALFAIPSPASAVSPEPTGMTYSYNSELRAALITDIAHHRGPPATSHDYASRSFTVDRGPHGTPVRPPAGDAGTYATYDADVWLVQGDIGRGLTERPARAADGVLRLVSGAMVAQRRCPVPMVHCAMLQRVGSPPILLRRRQFVRRPVMATPWPAQSRRLCIVA